MSATMPFTGFSPVASMTVKFLPKSQKMEPNNPKVIYDNDVDALGVEIVADFSLEIEGVLVSTTTWNLSN